MSEPPKSDRPANPIDVASVFRFSTELVAWVAAPWALWHVSPVLSVLSVLVLIGLPSVFGTIGDKNGTVQKIPVPVPGFVTVGLVLLQVVAAVVFSWWAWYPVIAIIATVLAAACVVFELPRWRWLLFSAAKPARRQAG